MIWTVHCDHLVSFLGRTAAEDTSDSGLPKATHGFSVHLFPILDGNDTARAGRFFPPSGALKANEYNGRVNVNNHDVENLAKPWGNNGGRSADVCTSKEQHRVLYTALGVVILRIKPDFLSRILPPDTEHIPDVLQTLLPIDISIGFINAAIVHKADKELYKVERALEAIEQYKALGQGECVCLPESVNQYEDAGFDRLAKCVALGFWEFVAVRV